MARRIDKATWDERQEWIVRQESSGVSVARFCRDHGLNLANFHVWKRKLRGNAPAKKPMASNLSGKSMTLAQTAFVQVPVQVPTQNMSSAPWVEVSSADGMVVRIPASNLHALQLVLNALNHAQEANHA